MSWPRPASVLLHMVPDQLGNSQSRLTASQQALGRAEPKRGAPKAHCCQGLAYSALSYLAKLPGTLLYGGTLTNQVHYLPSSQATWAREGFLAHQAQGEFK